MALERAGHQVAVASDGAEAFALLEAQPFDVLITDITMPRLGGIELCEKARHELGHTNLHLFVMTSRVENEFRDRAKRLEPVEFVEKPVSLRRLVARVGARLETTSSRDAE